MQDLRSIEHTHSAHRIQTSESSEEDRPVTRLLEEQQKTHSPEVPENYSSATCVVKFSAQKLSCCPSPSFSFFGSSRTGEKSALSERPNKKIMRLLTGTDKLVADKEIAYPQYPLVEAFFAKSPAENDIDDPGINMDSEVYDFLSAPNMMGVGLPPAFIDLILRRHVCIFTADDLRQVLLEGDLVELLDQVGPVFVTKYLTHFTRFWALKFYFREVQEQGRSKPKTLKTTTCPSDDAEDKKPPPLNFEDFDFRLFHKVFKKHQIKIKTTLQIVADEKAKELALELAGNLPPIGLTYAYDACLVLGDDAEESKKRQSVVNYSLSVEEDKQLVISPIDPELRFYDEWYRRRPGLSSVFPPDYGMSYRLIQPPGTFGPPLTIDTLEKALHKAILDLHRVSNNAVTDGYHIVYGLGATQVLSAAIHALTKEKPRPVFHKRPHWIRFAGITAYANTAHAKWIGGDVPKEEDNIPTSDIIEIVTHPNNPDNSMYEPQFEDSAKIHDMVYYFPNQQHPGTITPKAHDIMVFSMSKLANHSDVRFGWALVKDEKIAREMYNYMVNTIVSLPGPSAFRVTKVLQAIVQSTGTDDDFFKYSYKILTERHRRLLKLLEGTDYECASEFGVFFLIKCNNVPTDRDEGVTPEQYCQERFKSVGIDTRPGSRYGYSPQEAIVMTCIGDEKPFFETFFTSLSVLVGKLGKDDTSNRRQQSRRQYSQAHFIA